MRARIAGAVVLSVVVLVLCVAVLVASSAKGEPLSDFTVRLDMTGGEIGDLRVTATQPEYKDEPTPRFEYRLDFTNVGPSRFTVGDDSQSRALDTERKLALLRPGCRFQEPGKFEFPCPLIGSILELDPGETDSMTFSLQVDAPDGRGLEPATYSFKQPASYGIIDGPLVNGELGMTFVVERKS